jgi:hypothetical protein
MSRRRIKRTGRTVGRPGIPDKKISQTLIEFLEPLLEIADEAVSQDQIRSLFQIGVGIWNAATLEQSGDGDALLGELRGEIERSGEPLMTAIVDDLIRRKRSVFAHDLRLVGHYELVFDECGRFKLRAEARIKKHLLDVD